MSQVAQKSISLAVNWASNKVGVYLTFFKARLSLFVVLTAIFGYLIGANSIHWGQMVLLFVGGFLLTASSNGFNQVIEKDTDALMKRTKNRPIPSKKMSVPEGLFVASVTGVLGIAILFTFNVLSGILGILALFSYVALYTPMKRTSPWAVFVGAFPGAIPPMLGYVAATGHFGLEPGILFAIQFMWQFPHFWAIAWKTHEDYSKAGFYLLPTGKKDQLSIFLIALYSVFMLPVSVLPFVFGFCGYVGLVSGILLGLLMIYPAIKFLMTKDEKWALRIMFASFIYMPVMLLVLYIDKI